MTRLESEDGSSLLDSFMASIFIQRDPECSRALVDSNAGLRTVQWILVLFQLYMDRRDGDDKELSNELASLACYIAGSSDLHVVESIARVRWIANDVFDRNVNAETAKRAAEVLVAIDVEAIVGGSTEQIAFNVVNQISITMATLYRRLQDPRLLPRSIELARLAVELQPGNANALSNLSNRLGELYEVDPREVLLGEAISYLRKAIKSPEIDISSQWAISNNLVFRLIQLYDQLHDDSLLVEALERSSQALSLTELNLPARCQGLINRNRTLLAAYHSSGDRRCIEEAIDVGRRAVDIAENLTWETAVNALNQLANSLAGFFKLSGDIGTWHEVVASRDKAISLTPETSNQRAWLIDNRAICERDNFLRTGDSTFLNEAVAMRRKALRIAGKSALISARIYANLAADLRDLSAASNDLQVLHEAIGAARRAVELSGDRSVDLTERRLLLASNLQLGYRMISDLNMLSEAKSILDGLRPKDPGDLITRGFVSASVARAARSLPSAIEALEGSLAAFEAEVKRLQEDRIALRDLAGVSEGIISELASAYLSNGETTAAVQLLERQRTWLHHPKDLAHSRGSSSPTEMPTVWVFIGAEEIGVISSCGSANLIPVNREVLRRSVSILQRPSQSLRDRLEAADHLTSCATSVTKSLPRTEELLIVPTGLAAMLPFTAGANADGVALIDSCRVSTLPMRSWLMDGEAVQERPLAVGAFAEGEPALDIREDQVSFLRAYSEADILVEPSAEAVLRSFTSNYAAAHFSCHGVYNPVDPLGSYLALGSRLQLRDVVNLESSPWSVNLSSCSSGVPDLTRSEQFISFPVGFLLAGARHAIGTLWPVSNAMAVEYNCQFYAFISRGIGVASAHQATLRTMRGGDRADVAAQSGQLAKGSMRADHPFWWSTFVHYGQPDRHWAAN